MADQIEEVKGKVDIVSIIGEHVRLTKSGSNFKGLCPFHSEKTPSFMVTPELQIYKCFGCFPAGQFIKTPFGYHKIEDIVENEFVISGKGNIKKVLVRHEREYEGNMVIVKTSQLLEPVNLTEDHMVYTIGGASLYSNNYKYLSKRLNFYGKYSKEKKAASIWKYFPIQKTNAGSLKKGMSLLYPIDNAIEDIKVIDLTEYITKVWPAHGTKPLIPPLQIPITETFLKLIGYYIAEGSSNRAYIRFSLSSKEKDFANEIVKLIENVFKIRATIHKRETSRHSLEVTACNSILANIFENLCGKYAVNKHVPFIFQHLPFRKQKILLEAIYKGDGYETKLGDRTKTSRHNITIVSRTLSEQLLDILLRVGYFPSRSSEEEKYDKKGVHHQRTFTISWSLDPETAKHHHKYNDEDGSTYWILPVLKTKKEKFSGKVYNLTVEKDHSYVANNFAVANCGEGGDVFKFLELYEKMDFGEALRYLAEKVGVKLTSFKSDDGGEKEKLYELNELAAKFYHFLLVSHPIGKIALNYMKEERGLNVDSINTFNIGFAPRERNVLSEFLLKKKNQKPNDLIKAGLVYPARGKVFDRFEGRIIFPISNHRGQVVALAGRLLPPEKKNVGKYINSPETPIYHKSQSLYGLNITKDFIKKEGKAIVVEGELDLISSYQNGVKNVVAIKGSAVTEEQVSLLSRFTKEVILALDSDFAGGQATLRGISILENAGVETKVAKFGRFKDPDEASRADSKFYQSALQDAVPVWDFIIDSIVAKYDKSTGGGKAKISRELTPILGTIQDKIIEAHYIKKLARILDVDETAVEEEVEKKRERVDGKQEVKEVIEEKRGRRTLLEERLIGLIFAKEKKLMVDPKVRELIKNSFLKKVLEFENVEDLPQELKEKLAEIILSNSIEEVSKDEINETMHELQSLDIREKMAALSPQIGKRSVKLEFTKLSQKLEAISKMKI